MSDSTDRPTFTIWIQTERGETRKFENVTEVIEFPNRIEIQHDYREQSNGDIVRVRQTGVEHGPPAPGHKLLVYPEGEVENVVDALRLPSGDVKAADVTGQQHAVEGRIIWLKPEVAG